MMEALTPFDGIAIVIVIVSVLMALARGFMRELATLGAFMAALAAAYYTREIFHQPLSNLMPEGSPPWVPDAILVVGAFILIYIVVAWFGASLSKNLQGADGITLIDRLAGAAFGLLRGAVILVFFGFLLDLAMDKDQIPEFISEAQTYPLIEAGVDYIKDNIPEFAERNSDTLSLDVEPDAE
ncbi:CvpA family protein [Hyphomonas sp. FCG-A18]|jgi:membrane protein required for colicin V production|uniref:CvpA family protein n=1 Tax=Hyphomonas sp. FCG-A18 TaxID=3080019 RepID=UPI002B2CD729|nr:CvpA family protein [Hyphomonas sp. FCG-A18]